jgi:hypothetical protein
MALDIEKLRKRAAEGLALNEEALAAIRAADEADRITTLEQARAKRVVENLDAEPKLRAELEEAQADVRGLIHSLVQAIPRVRELRDRHEAIARMLRADGESCVQVPYLQVQSIQDRGLAHDLEALRIAVQSRY